MKTTIEWCDFTFNPWWGCQEISPGCAHCYAATLAKRFGHDVWRGQPRRLFGQKHWDEPRKWNAQAAATGVRRKVFCASMADVFEDHPDLFEERIKLWTLIEATPDLDWLLLTKRPENVLAMVPWRYHRYWPQNMWLGASVENQRFADSRIPALLQIPTKVRFLSCEPLLQAVDLNKAAWGTGLPRPPFDVQCRQWRGEEPNPLGAIDWVIAGSESGPKARPMHLDWVRSLRDQCVSAGVPFFLKQTTIKGRKVSLPELDGRQWAEFPRSGVAA